MNVQATGFLWGEHKTNASNMYCNHPLWYTALGSKKLHVTLLCLVVHLMVGTHYPVTSKMIGSPDSHLYLHLLEAHREHLRKVWTRHEPLHLHIHLCTHKQLFRVAMLSTHFEPKMSLGTTSLEVGSVLSKIEQMGRFRHGYCAHA